LIFFCLGYIILLFAFVDKSAFITKAKQFTTLTKKECQYGTVIKGPAFVECPPKHCAALHAFVPPGKGTQ
jgi:hypothetical protein